MGSRIKPIVITEKQWLSIKAVLKQENPLTTFMLRDRMKKCLGFTPRHHTHYDSKKGYYISQVHLDFYSERKKTMFLIKFSEELSLGSTCSYAQ
jgi:hypothetical protein